jgi:membrane associated rhomboid family serine protease
MIRSIIGCLATICLFLAGSLFNQNASVSLGLAGICAAILGYLCALNGERLGGFIHTTTSTFSIVQLWAATGKLCHGIPVETFGEIPVYIADTAIVPAGGVFVARLNGIRSLVIERAKEQPSV